MQKPKNIKILIGLFYLLLLFIFLYLIFSKFSLDEITTYKFIKNNSEYLINIKESNIFILSIIFVIFTIVWVFLLGFGSPIVLIAGFIFGEWLGVLLVTSSMAVGATFLYIFGNYFFKDLIIKKFLNKFKNLEKEIFKLSKKEFNIGSPKQLGEIIYNELKIAVLKKTRKGSFATSASVLEDLAFKGHKFPKLILDWRQVSKLKNTYSDSLREHININTKRVHTSFLLAATTTGRLASSNPNLQNIPIKSEDGKEIRKAFIAEKGFTLISADYNQIEMRILADLADVKELKKAFENNEDIHSLTASQVFNIDIKKVNEDIRRKAKAINFGIIYGISQYGLAKQIMVSNNEAEEFLNSYFLKFPEIKDYMNSTIKFCRKSGYVNNIFGRRTHIKGINDKNYNVRNFQERAAINAPIQGSASEIMRLAMIRLAEKFNELKIIKSKMLLQIHDELVFEVPNTELKKISSIIKEEMTSVVNSDLHSFSIPLTVDINLGDNWGILH